MLKVTFDGDKVAVTIILTKEANDEALTFLRDPQAFFSLDGKNQRRVFSKDSISGLYGLTIDSKDAPDLLDKELTKAIVDSTVESLDMLIEYTLDDYDEVKKKFVPSKYKIESECTYPIEGKPTKTTLGRAVFYKVTCEPLGLPFMNMTLTKKEQGKVLSIVDELVLEKLRAGDKEFFTETYIPWLNKWEEFSFAIADIYSPSIDMNIYATSEEYDDYRNKLIEENKEKIENGDIIAYDEMETKITAKLKETNAKEKIDTRIWDSGSSLSYSTDLRNGLVAVGPMPIGVGAGKFKISTSGLLYGIKKDERATYSQSNIVAGYFRAMGPATGGTISKEILGASHNIKFGPKGSDCGRKVGQIYEVDDYFVEHLHLRYMIKADGTLEQLTKKSLTEKYFGKRITVRAAHYCGIKGDPCNVCAGDQPYVVAGSADTVNVGAQKSRTGDEITQTSLSKFHESKTTFAYVDFNDFIVFSTTDIKESPFDGMIEEMNAYAYSILESEDEGELLDAALDNMDETLDELVADMPQEFLEFMDEEHLQALDHIGDIATSEEVSDIHRLLSSKAIELDRLKDIVAENKEFSMIPTSDFDSWFGGSSNHESDEFLKIALRTRIFGYTPVYMYNAVEEHDWYNFGLIIVGVKNVYTGDDTLINTLARVMEETELVVGDAYEVNVTLSEDTYFITADFKKLIPWYQIKDYHALEYRDEIDEMDAITESASDVAKGREEIASLERKMRSKTEAQIKQIINTYSIQKRKARSNISSNMNEKAAKLEVQMRADKEAYRKHLQEQLVQFENNYIKANKFKLFKLKNKLNFIFNKKSTAIEQAMNESVKHVQRKNREKLKANVLELKAKYGI